VVFDDSVVGGEGEIVGALFLVIFYLLKTPIISSNHQIIKYERLTILSFSMGSNPTKNSWRFIHQFVFWYFFYIQSSPPKAQANSTQPVSHHK
jgi:hypothetical protein